jgi:hypothetical protein
MFNIRSPIYCRNRKKCDYDAGMPCNMLKSQWRMLSVLLFARSSLLTVETPFGATLSSGDKEHLFRPAD